MSHDYHLNAQKLVELVVRECADVIQQQVGAKSAQDLLDHFGV
jgi:hypothetical protein